MTSLDIPRASVEHPIPIEDDLTTLNTMIENKSKDDVEKFFHDGFKINIPEPPEECTQITPIVQAILTEDLEWIKEIVDIFNKYSQPLNLTTVCMLTPHNPKTPFWVACKTSLSIAEYLLTELNLKVSHEELNYILHEFYIFYVQDIRPYLNLFIKHGYDINKWSCNLLHLVVTGYEEEYVMTNPDATLAKELMDVYGAKITPEIRQSILDHKEKIKPILEIIDLIDRFADGPFG